MMEFIKNSAFFGAMISLIAYEIGLILKKKFKMAIFNPLLISIICVIGVLVIFHIDYNDYNEGGKYISYLLTPATVCLAVPLYEQIHLLKKKSQGSCSRDHLRNAGGTLQRPAYVKAVRIQSSGICYHASEIHHNSHWNGSFRRTWRYRDYYSCGYHHHRSSGKHDRRGCL